jgi:hypothetical protein
MATTGRFSIRIQLGKLKKSTTQQATANPTNAAIATTRQHGSTAMAAMTAMSMRWDNSHDDGS